MSGPTWLNLTETPPGTTSALPPGTDASALHAALTAEIAHHLTPAHAALLARPTAAGTGLTWQAPGHDARRLSDLPPEGRRALLAATGAILSDVRRLAESGKAPTLDGVWPALRLVPSLASVFAVDGRPVIASWAHPAPGGGDPLAAFDDGVPSTPQAPPLWQPWVASLAAVALLAALAIILLPRIARWAVHEPAMCRIDPGQLELMRREAEAEARGNALRDVLAATDDEIGRRQLMCAIPTVTVPPPTPAPTPPPPPPPPPPRAQLPSEEWDRHDLSMLEGCWHSSTQMTTRQESTGQLQSVQEWRLCFDRNGHGRQSIRWNDGVTCSGTETASFDSNDNLLLLDTARCSGAGRNLYKGKFECKRVSDTEATCTRTDLEGSARGQAQTGRFSR